MPLFGKKQDKETEERVEALLARRQARKASKPVVGIDASNACPSLPVSTKAFPSSSIGIRTTSSDDRIHQEAKHSDLSRLEHAPLEGSTSLPSELSSELAVANEMIETLPTPVKSRFFWNKGKTKPIKDGSRRKSLMAPSSIVPASRTSTSSNISDDLSNSVSCSPVESPVPSPRLGRHVAGLPLLKNAVHATPQLSRLNVSLMEILSQNTALPYFLQYAEASDCLSMVQFWMAVESFSLSSLSRIHRYRAGAACPATVSHSQSSSLHSSQVNVSASGLSAGGVASSILRNITTVSSGDDVSRNGASLATMTTIAANNQAALSSSSPSIPIAVSAEKHNCHGNHRPSSPSSSCSNSIVPGDLSRSPSPLLSSTEHFPPLHKSAMLEFKEDPLPRQHSLSIQRDALTIYKQYISMQAKTPINIPIEIRHEIELGICQDDGFVSPYVFLEAQKTVFNLLLQHYYQPFLKSHFYCKFIIEILTSTTLRLSDVMLSDVCAMVFTEFMEQENALNLFQFWTLANSFQLDLKEQFQQGSYVGATALADAMAIYNRYFSLQATCPLHLGDEVRVAVEMSICCENEDGPQADCFSLPMYHVYTIIEQEYLSQFLTSNLYLSFLSKLVNSLSEHRRDDQHRMSLQHTQDVDNKSSAPLSDRCSLALPGTPSSAQIRLSVDNVRSQFTDLALGIDCGEDPDALWRRPSIPLNFGRVTEMGEYISDIEMYPDFKEIKVSFRTRMSHVVQKMMNTFLEESERQEMASRVARMIVTNVLQQTGQREAWLLQAGSYDTRLTPEVGVIVSGERLA